MARKASRHIGKLGVRGIRKRTRTAQDADKEHYTMPPVYAMDDLPPSVKAMLKALYPHSKHV